MAGLKASLFSGLVLLSLGAASASAQTPLPPDIRRVLDRRMAEGAGLAFTIDFEVMSDQGRGSQSVCAKATTRFDPRLPLERRFEITSIEELGCKRVLDGNIRNLSRHSNLDLHFSGSNQYRYRPVGPATVVTQDARSVTYSVMNERNPNFPGYAALGIADHRESNERIEDALARAGKQEFTLSKPAGALLQIRSFASDVAVRPMTIKEFEQLATMQEVQGCCHFPARLRETFEVRFMGMTQRAVQNLVFRNIERVSGIVRSTEQPRLSADPVVTSALPSMRERVDLERQFENQRQTIATSQSFLSRNLTVLQMDGVYGKLLAWHTANITSRMGNTVAGGRDGRLTVQDETSIADSARRIVDLSVARSASTPPAYRIRYPESALSYWVPAQHILSQLGRPTESAALGERALSLLEELDATPAVSARAARTRAASAQLIEAGLLWAGQDSPATLPALAQRLSDRRQRLISQQLLQESPQVLDRARYDAQVTQLRSVSAQVVGADVENRVTEATAALFETLRRDTARLIVRAPVTVSDALAQSRADAIVFVAVSGLTGSATVFTRNARGQIQGQTVEMPGAGEGVLRNILFGEEFNVLEAIKLSPEMEPVARGPIGGWVGALTSRPAQRAARVRQALPELERKSWEALGRSLHEALQKAGVRRGGRVALITSGAISMLPLPMALDPTSGERLIDRYEFIHAPTLEVLATAGRSANTWTSAGAVISGAFNPTGDLPYAGAEKALIAAALPAAQMAPLAAAVTPAQAIEQMSSASVWHFATHGTFNWDDPRKSGVALGGRPARWLTVGDILASRNTRRPRLVVLSACETGIIDLESNPDTFTGLPVAFLAGGAAGTVSTLWPVDDLSTALLMYRFYEALNAPGARPSAALRAAQLWLKSATAADLARALSAAIQKAPAAAVDRKLLEGFDMLSARDPTSRPYAAPYYWAAFIYGGA